MFAGLAASSHKAVVQLGQARADSITCIHSMTHAGTRGNVGDVDGVAAGVQVAERLLVGVGEGLAVAVAVAEEDKTGNMDASHAWIIPVGEMQGDDHFPEGARGKLFFKCFFSCLLTYLAERLPGGNFRNYKKQI